MIPFRMEYVMDQIRRRSRPRQPVKTAEQHTVRPGAGIVLLASFAAVYLIWGSTYLAIRVAIESLPPLLMAGGRFLAAGAVLYGWAWLRQRRRGVRGDDSERVGWKQWRAAFTIGALLLLGGNGLVVWAEQWLPSGLAAVLIATEPMWVVVLSWMWLGNRPGLGTLLGLAIGFAGLMSLVGPGAGDVNLLAAAAMVASALSWAAGSLYATRAKLHPSPLAATGMQMLAGGALLLLAGLARGEWATFDWGAVTGRSATARFYLLVFGSIVGFSAYAYLLKNTTATRAATYAYVNPVVAVLLGWGVAGEPLTAGMLLASAAIIASVVLITADALPRVRRGAGAWRRLRSSGAGRVTTPVAKCDAVVAAGD